MKNMTCSRCDLIDSRQIELDKIYSPDILIVGGNPSHYDFVYGPFRSSSGAMARKMVDSQLEMLPAALRPSISYTYAVRCATEEANAAITADIIAKCSNNLKSDIHRLQPKVILALGRDAAKSLGFNAPLSSLRGNFYDYKADYGDCNVLVTYHPGSIYGDKPGLTSVLENDISKAIRFCSGDIADDKMDLELPIKFDDVIKALTRAEKEIDKKYKDTGSPLLVAVDTETTSFNAWDKNQRMIMMSISYMENQGLAFPYLHRDVGYTNEEIERLKLKIESVLGGNKVYLVMQNGKFDIQWINGNSAIKIAYPKWDTQLVEHLIDEDKKGEYGLKALTRDYFPGYAKYEDELEAIRENIRSAKVNKYKEALLEFKTKSFAERVGYWSRITDEERFSLASKWVNAGLIDVATSQGLINLKYKARAKEPTLLKKCESTINKILSVIPDDQIPIKSFDEPDKNEMTIISYEDIPLDILIKYAAIDAMVTRKLAIRQIDRISKDEKIIKSTEKALNMRLNTKSLYWVKDNIVTPMSHIISDMEYTGIKLDREKTKKYIRVMQGAIDFALTSIFTEVGYRFNVNGNELIKILYETMKLPVIKKTDTGAPSVDADTIKQLYDNFDIPFLYQLLIYRKLEKQKNTYLENWLKMSEVDGRIHAFFNQTGTATYRLSSSNPNLQNLTFFVKEVPLEFVRLEFPKAENPGLNMKELFVADDGFDLYDLDISNAEMRVLCAYSMDDTMIDVFRNGKCMHCLTASGISDYSYDDILSNKENKNSAQYKVRQIGKKVNFGTIYCMSAPTLVNQLWSELRIKIEHDEAQGYLEGFFRTYPGVEKYIETTKRFAERFGYTFTYTGRRRRFPVLLFSRYHKNRVGRQAVNARIQTTSSDIIQRNMIDINKGLVEPNGGFMLLTVHDSMVFQLPKNSTGVRQKCDELITAKTAEMFPWLPVAWKYDIGVGPDYGNAHGAVS